MASCYIISVTSSLSFIFFKLAFSIFFFANNAPNTEVNKHSESNLNYYVTWIWICPMVHPSFWHIFAHLTDVTTLHYTLLLTIYLHWHKSSRGLVLLGRRTRLSFSRSWSTATLGCLWSHSSWLLTAFLISSLTVLTGSIRCRSSFRTDQGAFTIFLNIRFWNIWR